MSDSSGSGENGSRGVASAPQRPGLSALSYRVGTHAGFKEGMKEELYRCLSSFATAEDSDPSIALMDAAAAMLDVLAFYQERIANEGYLRTATERRSVLELARAIGYEIAPGAAAMVDLAFTVEGATGAPGRAFIPKGTKVQSVPGPGESAQVFETVEETREVRASWNELQVRGVRSQEIRFGLTKLYIKGAELQLQKGDLILVVGGERLMDVLSERWDARVLTKVTPCPKEGWTVVEWGEGLGKVNDKGNVVDPALDNPQVYVMRQRASLFGHNAPDPHVFDKDKYAEAIDGNWNWKNFTIDRTLPPRNPANPWVKRHPCQVDLDAQYPKVLKESWVVLTRGGRSSSGKRDANTERDDFAQLYRVVNATLGSRSDYSISSGITRLKVDKKKDLNQFGLRETVVYAQSEHLELAEPPLEEPVTGGRFQLTEAPKGIVNGQRVVAWGKEFGSEKEVAEVVAVTSVEGAFLTVAPPLACRYQGGTLCFNANLVRATHGETKQEVLGSGDASCPFQKFTLKQTPLTYLPASTVSGGTSTLEVRVNDVVWQETSSLLGHDEKSQVYTTRQDDDGKVTVLFGNGVTGARLPTGVENVSATYRIGTGSEGMVPPNRLTLLMNRPLGVRGVTNRRAAEGGSDRGSVDAARENAPFTVRTIERIVSLSDYEDFAQCFAGIGKARAAWLCDRRKRFVHLTVASAGGEAITQGSALFITLREAILKYGLPRQHFLIQSAPPLLFSVRARVQVREGYVREKVTAAVRSSLEKAFSFDVRCYGQPVTQSEVIALIQNVQGVEMVKLEQLSRGTAAGCDDLEAASALWDPATDAVVPAQILVLDKGGVEIAAIGGAGG
jgi:hypothetical protein